MALQLLSPINLIAKQVNSSCIDYIKAWGIVKYYSPFLRNNIPKLDSAFQSDIKSILKNGNKSTLNKAIEKLLSYAEKNSQIGTKKGIDAEISKQLDSINSWIIASTNISKLNGKRLLFTIHLDRDSSNPFVRNNPGNFAAEFINEKQFLATFPDVELRLLALARFWNAINFFYPYKNMIPASWDQILISNISDFINCENELGYHLLLLKLGTIIKDAHGKVNSYQIERNYGYFQLPFAVSYINDKLIASEINEIALNNPIKFGDIIQKINNKRFDEYFREDSSYILGCNLERIKNISAKNFLKTKEQRLMEVQVMRNDSIYNFLITTKHSSILNKTRFLDYKFRKGRIIGDEYIYLDLNIIDSIEFENSILEYNKPYIIIDLRSYPNWILNQIADIFAETKISFASYYYPKIANPGIFSVPKDLFLNPRRTDRKATYKKIFLLVNYNTFSRGEFLCMAFQSLPNVYSVGNRTAGADGNISEIVLPGNIAINFSGLGIQYPNGQKTQQVGVRIDQFYKRNGMGISKGRDEELDFIVKSMINGGKD